MRYLFPGDLVLLPPDAEGISKVAGSTVLTWWSDEVSGVAYTDIVGSDGVSPMPIVTTDPEGLRPWLYGPDGIKTMFMESGAAIRYVVYSSDALIALLATSADFDGGTL